MPTIPRSNDALSPTAPLPGVRKTPGVPAGAFGVPGGPDLSGLQGSVASIVAEERRKAFNTKLQDADNQAAELELRTLRDPETGVLNRRGENAFKADVDFSNAWRKGVGEIESRLKTQEQVDAFRRLASDRYVRAASQVQAHIAGEIETHTKDVFQTGLENAQSEAITAPDSGLRAAAIGKVRVLIDEYGSQAGWGGDMSQQRKAMAVSAIHAGVVDRMLSAGQDLAAKQYFDVVKDQLQGQELIKVQREVEQGSVDGAAARLAAKVWQEQGPRATNDAIKLSTMEDAIRAGGGDDQRIVKAAIAELRSRATSFNAQQAEITATNVNAVSKAFADGAPLARVKTMREYRALPGAKQLELQDAFTRGDDEVRERTGYPAFLALSNPTELIKFSDVQVQALLPSLGRQLTDRLLTMRRALGKAGDKIFAASIDDDVFKEVVAETADGIDPYAKNLSADQQKKLGRLKVEILTAIDEAQGKRDRVLSFDEKRSIARAIADRKVMVDRFGRDLSKAAYSQDPAKSYIPLQQIPRDDVLEALNLMRSSGLIPLSMSNAAALEKFKGRIERAAGAHRAGARDEDVYSILGIKKP